MAIHSSLTEDQDAEEISQIILSPLSVLDRVLGYNLLPWNAKKKGDHKLLPLFYWIHLIILIINKDSLSLMNLGGKGLLLGGSHF